MAVDYTITLPGGASEAIIANGALIRPGGTLDLDLSRVDPGVFQYINDGTVTVSPAMDPEIIEAGLSALHEDQTLPLPIATAADFRRKSNLKNAIYAAHRATNVVFQSTNSPQAAATGVECILILRDADGNDDLTTNALTITFGIGGITNQVITIPSDHQIDSSTTNVVKFRNGRARFTVVGDAGSGTVSMSATSRGTLLTISDTASITLS